MSNQMAINEAEKKRSNDEEAPSEKKSRVDSGGSSSGSTEILEDSTVTTTSEPTVSISAEEFFLSVLSKIPKGNKKKTLNSFIKTLLQLKETIIDEEDPEDEGFVRQALAAQEIVMQAPVILQGKPELAGQILPTASPITITRSPNPLLTTFSPTSTLSTDTVAVSYAPAVTIYCQNDNGLITSKMPALDACPPLTSNTLRQVQPQPAIHIPAVQSLSTSLNQQELMRMQHLRHEKVKMAPPQTMTTLDASLHAKERALHQAALQQATESDMMLVESLKHKILQSIHSNHNGKANPEEICRYLKQNFFMILENNQYIYVPNPWHQKPTFVRQFMTSAAAQQTQQLPGTMMLPPRPPQTIQTSQMQQISNMPTILQPQIVTSMGSMMTPGSAHNWPPGQNIFLNTLQPNMSSTSSGIQVMSSLKAGRPAV